MDSSKLLVPFAIETKIQNKYNDTQNRIGKVTPDYRTVDSSFLGGKLEAQPFSTLPPLEKGIHLHFILPKALTTGVQNGEEFNYPCIPNRWIVTRIVETTGEYFNPKLIFKSWIIESDYIGLDNTQSVVIPTLEDSSKYYRYLGRTYEIHKVPEQGSYLQKLTAIGPGDSAFMAYYPSCYSVIGFHDSLEGIAEAKLTYMVLGFYSDEKMEPFHGLNPEACRERLEEFSWTVPENSSLPNGTLLHSMVYDINWQGEEYDYPSGMPSGRVDVCIANSSVEAISALIARDKMQDGISHLELERLLTALQYDILEHYDLVEGIVKVEELIHKKTFQEELIGTHWAVRKNPDNSKQDNSVPDGTGKKLNKLNTSQQETDNLKNLIMQLKKKLYDSWYIYMLNYSSGKPPAPTGETPPKKDAILAEIELCCTQLDKAAFEYKTALEETEAIRQSLTQLLKNAGSFYTLEKAASLKYYKPNDPVVMLGGSGIKRSFTFGEEGRFSDNGHSLACRFPGQMVNGCTAIVNQSKIQLTNQELYTFLPAFPQDCPHYEILAGLFWETIYLDQSKRDLLAAVAFQKTSQIPSKEELRQTAGTIRLTGQPPSPIGINLFSPSWSTLFLEWRGIYLPTRTSLDAGDALTGWEFSEIEYECTRAQRSKGVTYAGRTIVTPHSQVVFKAAIDNQIERYKDDIETYEKLLKISRSLLRLNVVSQKLGGFNEQLVSMLQTVQLPVMDKKSGNVPLAQKVSSYLGNQDSISVDPKMEFFPIRAGFFTITEACLISSFGEIQQLTGHMNDITISEPLTPQLVEMDGFAMLPPRIMEYSRIHFDWLSTGSPGDESNIDPKTSPIYGYIIPNLLNRGLMVYSPEGKLAGHIKLFYEGSGKTSARWQDASLTKDTAFPNADLQLFVEGILAHNDSPGGVFDSFLRLIDYRLSRTYAETHVHTRNISVLCGRPIALARCAIKLEEVKTPVYSLKYKDYKKYNTLDYEKIGFPIRLGDITRVDCGVLGYFEDVPSDKKYKEFVPVYGTPKMDSSSPYIKYNKPLYLSLEEPPKVVTLLIEPMSKMNIKTGGACRTALRALYKGS